MATTRIKDISKTTTDLASDTYGVFDGSTNGTQKMSRDDMYADWAAAYVAAPTTYKLAPLNSGTNKIDATYLPTSGDTPKGEWNANTNSPALADGSGTAGDYYDVTTAGTQDLGSGSIAYTVGDVVKYNGSTWYKIDSVANILDGSATAADGRSTLSVNSKDEDAQANALKTTAPALYFNGTSSVVTVADDDKLSFTDGTDDLPFSLSAWVNLNDITSSGVVGKYGTTSANVEWSLYFGSDDKLYFQIQTASTTNASYINTAAMTGYENEWIHLAATYGGAGPNSANAFTNAADSSNMEVYVNGVLQSVTRTNNASYAGMSNTAQALWIGRTSSNYAKGSIRDAKIFNRTLTASEAAELARGNDLGFADEFGGSFGGLGTIDETSGLASWTGAGSITADNLTQTANTTVGARANVLKLEATATTTGNTRFYITSLPLGKRLRIDFDYYINSGNTTNDSLELLFSSGSTILQANTSGAWARASVECVSDGSGPVLQIRFTDNYVMNATAGDFFGIDNFKITEIGTLADFRAERYDTSTNKLYDLSDNAFVGTGTNVTLTGREQPVYTTGTWTPSITFGGGSTGIAYTTQEGLYTRIGDTVWVSAYVLLSSKGSDTGTALVNGLPFTASNSAASSQSLTVGNAANAASLTSAITAYVTDNGTTINLVDWGATGSAVLDDTNFAATTALSITGIYKIQ